MGTTVLLGLLAVAGAAMVNAVTGMLSQETQTRLARLPVALLRMARMLVPGEQRDERHREWVAEISYIAKETDGLPVTRLLKGLKFAVEAIIGAVAIRRLNWLGARRTAAEADLQVRLEEAGRLSEATEAKWAALANAEAQRLQEQIQSLGADHVAMKRFITQVARMDVPQTISAGNTSILDSLPRSQWRKLINAIGDLPEPGEPGGAGSGTP